MKHSTKLALILSAVVVFALACDRKERNLADVSDHAAGVSASTVQVSYSTVPANSNVSEVAPKTGKAGIDGQEVYMRTCVACHQATGLGVPSAFPPLDNSPYVLSNNVERMASIMLYGLLGPIKVKGAVYNGVMLPQRTLSDAELSAVAGYVRSSWSNKAAAVEPEVFAKMRQKWGERAQFNISELGEEAE